MQDPIRQLRALAAAGESDYTIGAETFWTDDQLQEMLDQQRSDWRRVGLIQDPVQVDGTVYYYDYLIPSSYGHWWERATGGTTVWRIENSIGNTQGTALYTVDYDGGRISFSADQAGSALYLTGRTFDLYAAAAAVWRRKAAYGSADVDWATDGHRVNASQGTDFCLKMADSFDMMAGPRTVQMVRSDTRRR